MGRLLTVLGFAILAAAPPLSPLAASAAEARAIVSPCQITAEAESLLSFTVSADGGTILYSLTREIGSDLWLRNADPAAFTPPQRLTDDVAEEREPDLAADGRLLTYTGTAHDVKGDIYLLDLADRAKPPVRLTGREGEEGSPRFSPDGTKIYFHTRAQAGAPWQLAVADRASGRVEPLATGGDAASPAPSPDGSKLAFASSRSDAKGADIYYLDLASGQVVQVTFGPAIDLAPRWSPDSKEIFFARINLDTNRDGAVTREDRAAIFHTRLAEGSATYPLTPYSYSAHSPLVRGAYLYFLANQGSIDNCWRLPTTGQIPVTGDAKSQLELAHRLDHQIPARPDEAILGYLQVADRHGRDRAARARALYQAGLLFKEEGYLKVALELFGAICPEPTARCEEPHSSLARIEAIVITARLEEEAGRPEAREEAIAALTPLAASPESRIALVAVIEKVRLETHGSPAPGRVMAAMAELDLALAAHGTVRDKAAEATLMKADLFSRFNPPAATYPLFQKVLRAFADQEEWSDLAAARIVDLLLADTATSDRAMRIAALRRIAEENKVALPRIAMTALNRLADIYYQMDESAKAKQLYFQLIDTFPGVSTQSGAARLALAEILYQEQRFREALDLYQAEIDARPEADSIWMLARQGYIQKSLAEAEYLFRLGEVTGAKKIFKELIDYDPTIVEAHRGLIKSAAALGTIAETVAHYQALAGQAPSDPIAIYGTALSLTYLNTEESARRAMELLAQAITIRGDSEYFRQTAGYVFEVLETVYGQKGMLEQALDEYRKAFSLNSRTANRANRANLLLNLGNTNYLLGRYEQAFSYFTRRAAEPEPFSDPNTEILFFRRLGHSAYQSRDTGEAIK
ncbi:MAG: tetratricopeptide repeat protein, partial [Desulfobulbaceae bacterium]|nr:tetratricopeptide repeat protein [Desulfobulbaceae bacterium]